MIKFFRKIRQKMISENKISKYLLYTIGEIVLVVIGILIALQINTWNQEKILKQKETKYLIELKNNLERNIRELNRFNRVQNGIINRGKRLISYKESSVVYHDSLSQYFNGISWLEQIDLVNSTYETMKTTGLGLVSTDSLRLTIINLHEVRYGHFENFIKDTALANYSSLVLPLHNKYFDYYNRYNSNEYIVFLKNRIQIKEIGYVRIANDLITETEGLIKQINNELD